MTEAQEITYDVVVLGAGAVGENAADRAGRTGLRVVIVESELVGGECSYWACMPSKALLRPGAVLAAARAVPGAAEVTGASIDATATLQRRDAFASHWKDSGQVEWLESAGIDLLRGHARFTAPRTLEVTRPDGEHTTLRARYAVVVATGSRPVMPPIDGLEAARPWTSREATSADEVPRRLAIIGGGVVACEMATAYRDLGSVVTVLARGPRLLPHDEDFAGQAVADALTASGVDVRLGTEVTSVRRDADGVHLAVAGGDLTADELLVATGRRPATDDLGLAHLGLAPGDALEADDSLAVTAVPGGWLYAAGDVTGRTATTHQGKYDARVAGDVIAARFAPDGAGHGDAGHGGAGHDDAGHAEPASRETERADPSRLQDESADLNPAAEAVATAWSRFRASADHEAAPQVVFTRPEVASVGLTLAAAREAGYPARAVDYDLGSVAGAAVAADGYAGRARIVVDTERRVLLGATFVGPEVAELVHAATIAVVGQVTLDRLWHAVPAYPTVSEVWLRLLETAGL